MGLGYVIDTQYRHAVTTCHGHHQSLCETHPCGSYKRPRGATEDFQAARNSCGVARSLTTWGTSGMVEGSQNDLGRWSILINIIDEKIPYDGV